MTSFRILRSGSFRLVKPLNKPDYLPAPSSSSSLSPAPTPYHYNQQQQATSSPYDIGNRPFPSTIPEEVLGELEFAEDQIHPVVVLGIGLPDGLDLGKKVEDLGGKRRQFRVRVVNLDTIVLHFLHSGKLDDKEAI